MNQRKRRTEIGFTLIELLIVVALIGIVVSIAIPGWLRARINGNETAAIVALLAIRDAQASYAAICGNDAYAVLFPTLAVGPASSSTGFLSPDLTGSAEPLKGGYVFSLTARAGSSAGPNDCNGTPTATTFYASARPASPGVSGTRAFATNQENTIWQDTTGVPPTEPFTAGDTVRPVQ